MTNREKHLDYLKDNAERDYLLHNIYSRTFNLLEVELNLCSNDYNRKQIIHLKELHRIFRNQTEFYKKSYKNQFKDCGASKDEINLIISDLNSLLTELFNSSI